MFQISEKDGKEVEKLTSDENGKATSEPLWFGKYTVEEIQAPNGYVLIRDPFEVEVLTSLQNIKVENTKKRMEYSKYCRYSANYFYLIGTILMVATLVLFFRKRGRNE